MKKNIIFIGGGGHSLVCADIINQNKDLTLAGFVDKKKDALLSKSGYQYLGNDQKLDDLVKDYKYFFISLGQIKSPLKRIEIFKKIINLGGNFIKLISKYSYVSPSAIIDTGTIIMNGTVVNAKSVIGKNCIINTNAVIEHGVNIESNVHVAPSATILGDANIKEGCFIGAGAIVREGVTIEKNTIVSAGDNIMFNKKSVKLN